MNQPEMQYYPLRRNINIENNNNNFPIQNKSIYQSKQPQPRKLEMIQQRNVSYKPQNVELNVSLPVQQNIIKPIKTIKEQISTTSSSHKTSPIQIIEEEKQESFIICSDDEEEEVNNLQRNELGDLLRSNSSFLEVADEDLTEQEQQENYVVNNTQLSSCTQFELSSRPTTAIPVNLIPDDNNKQQILSPLRQSNSTYSSFGHNEQQYEDSFAVHVVVDDSKYHNNNDNDKKSQQEIKSLKSSSMNEEQWKQISDVDRDNVASLRDAFQELSKQDQDEVFPIYGNIDNDDITEIDDMTEVDVIETIDNNVPVATPNTSMNKETFVVKYVESKQHEEKQQDDENRDSEYEDDFEIESEHQQQQQQQQQIAESRNNRDVLRLPELDASINNFASKIYDIYSSFDESLMTNSVASSSDLSNKSPNKNKQKCQTIVE